MTVGDEPKALQSRQLLHSKYWSDPMPKGHIFLDRSSESNGTMSFELTDIYTSGGPDFPALMLRTEIGLSPYIDRTQREHVTNTLSLIRAVGQLRSPDHQTVASFQQDIALTASNPSFVTTNKIAFEIPVDLVTLTRIEKTRAGGNLRVNLTFQLLMALYIENGGFRSFTLGRVDGLVFEIPRSQWVDTLLPALGYGGLEVIEIRYGAGVVAQALPKSIEEIQEAKKCLLEGHWQRAIGHCRKAIEVILESRPLTIAQTAKFRDKVSDFISGNLSGLNDSQVKLLSKQMELIWEVGSQAAHPSPASPFTRADAEFIVRSTMAVVEYFSRLLN